MEKAKQLENANRICHLRDVFHRRSLACGVVWLLCWLLAACSQTSPEQRLQQQFEQMQMAVEERRADDFMAGVSADFAGKNGMDRAALHNLLRLQMLGNASVGVTRGPLEIQWQGDHATVKCSVLLTGGGGRFLPERAQTYAITSGWREEDGEWRVYYAEWHAAR
jgi:hypothetical protein